MNEPWQTSAGFERRQALLVADLARETVMYNEDKTMTNGMNPSDMTGPERLAEVSTLLSLAMMRVWMKRRGRAQSARLQPESSSHFSSRSSCLDERDFSTNPSKTASIRLDSSRNNGSL